MSLVRRELRAMGCDVTLLVVANDPGCGAYPDAVASDPSAPPALGVSGAEIAAALDAATARLGELEARWTRFRPTSELSQLNGAGRFQGLSVETYELIADALEAWRATDALFDPTVLDALVAAGYDRTIEEVRVAGPVTAEQAVGAPPSDDDTPRAPVPGPVGIELDPDSRSVVLPVGVHLDLGGIGKGRAADLVARLLHDRLGGGVCVDLGGDLRAIGPGPDDAPWGIEVADPFDPGASLTVVALDDGAVATSARTARVWQLEGRPVAHHLIDPATGRPAASGLASVSVIAQDTQWAEVIAKAAFVAGLGPGADLITGLGLDGILVTDAGWVVRTPGFHRFERQVDG